MRFISRSALGALVAVLAVTAASASPALASEPAFSAAHYPDSLELTERENLPQYPSIVTAAGHSISCTGEASKGEVSSSKTSSLTFVFTSCEARGFTKPANGTKCNSAGAKAGEVKTAKLEGKPVYLNHLKEVGLVWAASGGGSFAEIECGTGTEKETLKLRGSLLAGGVRPPNAGTALKQFRFSLHQTKGVQEPSEYENEHKETTKAVLETEGSGATPFAYERTGVGETFASILTAAEGLEVQAHSLASAGLPEFTTQTTAKGSLEGWGYSEGSFTYRYAKGSFPSFAFNGPNEVVLILQAEEGESFEGPCFTNEKKQLVTNELIGRLGYTNKSAKEVGVLLEPIAQPVAKCTGRVGAGELRGSMVGRFTRSNESLTELHVAFERELNKFEGEEVVHDLTNHERATPEGGWILRPAKAEEIKA
jgi:hypothetical protein